MVLATAGKIVRGAGAVARLVSWVVSRGERQRVTVDHVVWGYRLFLDREPENETVVVGKVRICPDTEELRRDFMQSFEFQQRNPRYGLDQSLGEKNVVIKELDGGLRLFVDLSDYWIGLAITRNAYEHGEIAFVHKHLKPGQVALDIGANIGFFTVNMADVVGPTGHVYAFEPVRENVEMQRKSIAENRFEDRVTLEAAAVGAGSGTMRLVINEVGHNSGAAAIDPGGRMAYPGHRVDTVKLVKIDELQLRRPVSFVKIDVEGAELLALQGAEGVLRGDRPVILSEINTTQLHAVSGCAPLEFIGAIEEYGYRCVMLDTMKPAREFPEISEFGVRSVVFMPR